MTIQDIVQELLKEPDKYIIEREEMIPIGIEPVRKHKKRRIQKKYIKRYGMKTIYEKKKVKAIDVTMDMLLDFCQEKNIPITDIVNLNYNGDNNGESKE